MKVELTAISKQSLHASTASATAAQEPDAKIIMAQFESIDPGAVPPYGGGGVFVPYALVEGAQVGDVFTLHLERATK